MAKKHWAIRRQLGQIKLAAFIIILLTFALSGHLISSWIYCNTTQPLNRSLKK